MCVFVHAKGGTQMANSHVRRIQLFFCGCKKYMPLSSLPLGTWYPK